MMQQRVVGVAVLHEGRLLAARRASPAEAAGRWELPGGKCDPGETLEEAAVREIREELDCDIRVTGVLDGGQPISRGLVLQVVTAELAAGEPIPHEHDALRWLASDQLDEVAWLPADVPFVEQIESRHARPPRRTREAP